jgi:hypothetical protein
MTQRQPESHDSSHDSLYLLYCLPKHTGTAGMELDAQKVRNWASAPLYWFCVEDDQACWSVQAIFMDSSGERGGVMGWGVEVGGSGFSNWGVCRYLAVEVWISHSEYGDRGWYIGCVAHAWQVSLSLYSL